MNIFKELSYCDTNKMRGNGYTPLLLQMLRGQLQTIDPAVTEGGTFGEETRTIENG